MHQAASSRAGAAKSFVIISESCAKVYVQAQKSPEVIRAHLAQKLKYSVLTPYLSYDSNGKNLSSVSPLKP